MSALKATVLTLLGVALALGSLAVIVWTHGAVLILFSVFLFWYVLFDYFRENPNVNNNE